MLSEADLGICLFFMPLGAFLAMLSAGLLIRKWGAGPVTLWVTVAYCLCMMLPLLTPTPVWLGAALFVVGMTIGIMDIAMNAVAAAFEKTYERIIMATTHGFYSLGGMVGAFLGSLALGIQLPGWLTMVLGIVICLVMLGWIRSQIGDVAGEEDPGGKHFSLPGKAVIGLAVIGLCSMIGEGAIADWSGIYLETVTLADGAMVGLGYAGFSLAMTIGRFYGDALISRFGGFRIILLGSLFIMTGMGIILLAESYSSVLGFTLTGFGYSSIIPVVFSQAARMDETSASRGITAVASFGYMGFLIGPVLIGLISEWGSLRLGMLFLLFTAVLTFILSFTSMKRT